MHFDNVIGQNKIKKALNFYLRAYDRTGKSPFLLFAGPSGLGKTEFSKAYAKGLKSLSGTAKTFYEINSSTIKNVDSFLTTVHARCISNKDSIILFDEAHALKKEIMDLFLSIFNSSAKDHYDLIHDGELFRFNFRRNVFIFATTETDKLFPPFKNRLKMLNFIPYTPTELGDIIQIREEGIQYEDLALKTLASVVRGNARDAAKLVEDVVAYCEAKSDVNFTMEDVHEFFDIFDIQPFGLTQSEIQILQKLDQGPATLSVLAAATGNSSTSIRRDHEHFLLKKGFMMIDGKRHLTPKGQQALDFIKRSVYLDEE